MMRFSRVRTAFHYLGNRLNRAYVSIRQSLELMSTSRITQVDDAMYIIVHLGYSAIESGDPEMFDQASSLFEVRVS